MTPALPPVKLGGVTESVQLAAEIVAEYNCVVLATDHDAFDYPKLTSHATLLIDTRARLRESTNVVHA